MRGGVEGIEVVLRPNMSSRWTHEPRHALMHGIAALIKSKIKVLLLVLVIILILLNLLFLNLHTLPSPHDHSFTPLLKAGERKGNGEGKGLEGRWRVLEEGMGVPWRELVATWNRSNMFPLKSSVGDEILNPYPNHVKFPMDVSGPCVEPPLVLALVVTAPGNLAKRQFVRGTWGHPGLYERTGIRPFFMLGQTKDPQMQARLVMESRQHHDLIQANFVDSYRNLTYKTTALLTWAASRCPDAPFVLKIDDDVIPNPVLLRAYLSMYMKLKPRPLHHILGKLRCCDPVLRETKWAVSVEDYPDPGYPPYVAGPSYIVPSPAIPALLHAVRRTKFLFLEDVYHTGLAARRAGIPHHSIVSLTNSLPAKMDALWVSGARVFQENVGVRDATRAWNSLRVRENITDIPPYQLPQAPS